MKSDDKILMNMNTEDFNIMRKMLSEIEMKIIQLPPLKQRQFYAPLQRIICEAWQDVINPNDEFLYHQEKK